jgi:hypothetical protein
VGESESRSPIADLCDKRAIDHYRVLISPSRSMFALLPAPSLLHFGEMRFMRFEALFPAAARAFGGVKGCTTRSYASQ